MRRLLILSLLPLIALLSGCGKKETPKPAPAPKTEKAAPAPAPKPEPQNNSAETSKNVPHISFNSAVANGGAESTPAPETKPASKAPAPATAPSTTPAAQKPEAASTAATKKSNQQSPAARVFYRPFYPFSARLAGFEGEVVLRFIVDKDGNVVEPTVASSTIPELSKYVIEAARHWKFFPATENGKPIDLPVTYTYDYQSEFGTAGVRPGSIFDHIRLMKNFDSYYELTKDGWKPANIGVTPIYRAEPQFADSDTAKETGTVTLTFTVTTEGRATDPKVVESTNPDLNNAALTAIKYWEFIPQMKNGIPVARDNVQVPFQFSGNKKTAAAAKTGK